MSKVDETVSSARRMGEKAKEYANARASYSFNSKTSIQIYLSTIAKS